MQEADHECMRLQTLHQGSRDRRAVVGMPATSLLLTRTRLGLGQVWPKVEGGSEQGGFAGRLSKAPNRAAAEVLLGCWAGEFRLQARLSVCRREADVQERAAGRIVSGTRRHHNNTSLRSAFSTDAHCNSASAMESA
ncbi:hypothetical protein L1887_50610 [Cichorium endivia]|nr:hypothetical protein L1887_50610 [Cichorium endivia]